MSCGTSPIFSLTGSVSLLTRLFSIRTSPESGFSNPAMIETVFVLPAPFGPSRPTVSPEFARKLTPLIALSFPYVFVMRLISSIAKEYTTFGTDSLAR
jgi:hypothetical protein